MSKMSDNTDDPNHNKNGGMGEKGEIHDNIQSLLDPVTAEARKLILLESGRVPDAAKPVHGYDFNTGVDYDKLIQSFSSIGFQATHLGNSVQAVNKMIDCRFSLTPEQARTKNVAGQRRVNNCTIFLGYTSNIVSAGTREIIRYLVEHNMVDCIVTSGGGIEEDMMKCWSPFYQGDWNLDGATLCGQGHQRQGNIIVPNNGYISLHEFLNPILETMSEEQANGINWTPQKLIWRMGKEVNNKSSIYYWAYKNQIPVFCPAITDGGIGDVLVFHRHAFKEAAVRLDVVEDVQAISNMALHSVNTAGIVLGGGVGKHHILNANCIKGGLNHALYINTAYEYDGSDSGASPDEAKSWGKINPHSRPVKVYADATLVFPIIVAQTFAKREKEFHVF